MSRKPDELLEAMAKASRQNLLERMIAKASPERAARRMRSRMSMAAAQTMTGGYTGASRKRRTLGKWGLRNPDINALVAHDRPDLIARSHDLVRNSPLATGAITVLGNKTVGTGLALVLKPHREILGWTEEQAQAWVDSVMPRWDAFVESPLCTANMRTNFYGVQRLAYDSSNTDGDCFVTFPQVERFGRRAMAFDVIEGGRVSTPTNVRDKDNLFDGVVVDEYGAVRRIYAQKTHPSNLGMGRVEWAAVDLYQPDTGLRNGCQIGRQLRPGQIRGVPLLSPIVEVVKQLTRLTEEEVNAAVVAGMMAVFVTAEGQQQMDLLPPEGEALKSGGSGAGDDGASWDGTFEPGGNTVYLNPGQEVTSVAPGRPNPIFGDFWQSVARQVGMATDIPFEVLIKHFQASYSASRAAQLELWLSTRVRRASLASELCQPAFETWLWFEVLAGRVVAPGFTDDPLLRWAYTRSEWHGDGPGSLDPQRETQAANERIRANISTLEREVLLDSGGDWRSVVEQRGLEIRAQRDAGAPEARSMPGQSDPQGNGQAGKEEIDSNGDSAADRRDQQENQDGNA